MREKIKNFSERGITLIALVVTIIIMLILAGVALNMALGDNGLIQMSKFATNMYEKSAINESTEMGRLEEILNNLGSVSPTKSTTPSLGETVEIDITDVHLGDKWKNVAFKDLSSEVTSEEAGSIPKGYLQGIFIENEQNGNRMFMVLSNKSSSDGENPVLKVGWFKEGSSVDITDNCDYYFKNPQPSDGWEEYNNTGWYTPSTNQRYSKVSNQWDRCRYCG